MRMKMIVKIGTMISILLFVLAVGYFALVRLDITGRSRDINLFSLVPSDCIGVLESGNVNAFLNECSNLNYSRELEGFQFPGLFSFLINELNDYTSETHGLSSEMSRLLVSFHRPGTSMDQVVYFRMGKLIDVLEMVIDCTVAGLARSGDVYGIEISKEVLDKAIENTKNMIIENVEVVDNNG